MHPVPPLLFVPVSTAPQRWSVSTFRALMKQANDAGGFGKRGGRFIAFLDETPDEVIAEELRLRDGPSVAQILFERSRVDSLGHRVRVEKLLADETRRRNEKLLRRFKSGPRKPANWREAARDFKQLTDGGLSDRDAVRILDPKHFGRPNIYNPKRASKRAETYKRWVSDL